MKTLSFPRCFGALLWLCAVAVPGLAQTATPTPAPTVYSLVDPDCGIFTSDDEADEDEVRDAARVQASPYGVPAYKSNGEETRFYEGYFKAKTDETKLALLSDDGTTVWIDEVPVLSNADQNQGFEPSAAATFSLIPKTFVAGRIYHLKLQYTNTIHTGDADVDGLSLWAYAGGGDIVEPTLTVTTDRTSLCAGGWANRSDSPYPSAPSDPYQYLEKETGNWKTRVKPDPHIATLTATVKVDGQPVAGRQVTFTWDMPGPAPDGTHTATTDADGKATADVTSGDEVSTDTNERGQVLFNRPVTVRVRCEGQRASQNLDVEAANIQWQYKNQNDSYVAWNGDIYGLYTDDTRTTIPLRALLKHNGLPVIGHPVSWAIEKVRDKSGAEVTGTSADSYGRLSGDISTTAADGSATATFTRGSKLGQIVFAIEDDNVYTLDTTPTAPSAPVTPTASSNLFRGGFLLVQTQQESPYEIPLRRRKKKSRFRTPNTSEYTHVKGVAAFSNKWGYPAPAGEEDDELLPKTFNLVAPRLNRLSPEVTDGWRGNFGDITQGGGVDPFGDEAPGWWFSQVIGDDPDSAGYHLADLKITTNGKTRYYGAAFDIVLRHVGIFVPGGRRTEFGPYVKAMRGQGIVAWHRWAGEDRNEDGRLASVQNEMHCIDPAVHIRKSDLDRQISAFTRKESGGSDYNPEPNSGNAEPDNRDFVITSQQLKAVRLRATTKRTEFASVYSTATPVPFPPPR